MKTTQRASHGDRRDARPSERRPAAGALAEPFAKKGRSSRRRSPAQPARPTAGDRPVAVTVEADHDDRRLEEGDAAGTSSSAIPHYPYHTDRSSYITQQALPCCRRRRSRRRARTSR